MALGEFICDAYTIGLWNFSENANDVSPSANHGTITGATLTNAKFGQGYNFASAGDRMTLAAHPTVGLSECTLEFWVKPGTTGIQALYSEHYDANMWFQNTIYATAWYTRDTTVGATGNRHVLTFTSIPTTAYAYLAFVYSVTANSKRLYLNGALHASASLNGRGALTTERTATVIGYYDATNYFRGILDAVRISNIARSAADLRAYYQHAVNGIVAFL